MKELDLIRQRIGIPPGFLTTVTCNTFRPEYYFSKIDVVGKAVAVHKAFVSKDPQGYKEAVMRALPIMLDAHKILSAIYLWDNNLANEDELLGILSLVRPDHIANFWITIKEHRRILGLKHKSLSASARKLLWKFMERVATMRGKRQVALWLMKNKKSWNKAFYYTHTKLEDEDLEELVATFAFGRKHEVTWNDESVEMMMIDIATLDRKRKEKSLTIKDFKESRLPYRMLEGYASGQLDTTTKEWYWAVLDKMTNYEVLRRTDAMHRCGFLKDYFDIYRKRALRMASRVDPVAIGSVILQHPELLDYLIDPLLDSLGSVHIELPKNSVMLCDSSRSMKLKRTRPQPRLLWELVAYVTYEAKIPTYLFSDKPREFKKAGRPFLAEGAARGPTSISRALLRAKEHKPDWIFLLSDMQQNIPFRGHEKEVAKKIDATIVTLNPTVNPLEPEAATRLETPNEIFLPIHGLRQFEKILKVVVE